MTDLLPCPFCQGDVQFRKALHISDGNVDSIIHASASTCPMIVFEDGSVDESILSKWNTRTPAQSPLHEPRFQDLHARLLRAITTASDDDLSEPMSDKRLRHVERISAMHVAIDFIDAALTPAESKP